MRLAGVLRLQAFEALCCGWWFEEVRFLRAAGIPYEVIPGHHHRGGGRRLRGTAPDRRRQASAVAFRTGHTEQVAASEADTLVYYMAAARR